MREEIAHARDQNGISARKFDKYQSSRPLSQLSDSSSDEVRSQIDVSRIETQVSNKKVPLKV